MRNVEFSPISTPPRHGTTSKGFCRRAGDRRAKCWDQNLTLQSIYQFFTMNEDHPSRIHWNQNSEVHAWVEPFLFIFYFFFVFFECYEWSLLISTSTSQPNISVHLKISSVDHSAVPINMTKLPQKLRRKATPNQLLHRKKQL